MSTLAQVVTFRLKTQQFAKKKISALCKNPQKKGICLNVLIKNPKKPNSARRKVAKVKLHPHRPHQGAAGISEPAPRTGLRNGRNAGTAAGAG